MNSTNTKRGIIQRIFHFILQFIGYLFLAMIISLLVTGIFLILCGEKVACLKLQTLIQYQQNWLQQYFAHETRECSFVQFIENTINYIQSFRTHSQYTNPITFFNLESARHSFQESLRFLYLRGITFFSDFLLSIELCLLRIATLYLFWPLFLLFIAIGFIDGITQRHLRKIRGGRESTLLYHTAHSLFKPILFVSLVMDISLPFSINPEIILLPAGVGLMFSVFLATKMFKKYL
jgi:integrating conjugative element membrane protein (TIGR03747 family)